MTSGRPSTLRSDQKQATRQRVIEVGRALFRDHGYEAVTIRDIAQAAQVSVGTVIGAFGSKADLFNEVVVAIYGDTARVARAADPGPAHHSVVERLTLRTRAVYDDQLKQLGLVRDGMMIAWLRSKEADRRNRSGANEIFNDLTIILEDGIAKGELSPALSVPMAIEIIFTLYQNNYRRAIFGNWDSERLAALFCEQMTFLLRGMAPHV